MGPTEPRDAILNEISRLKNDFLKLIVRGFRRVLRFPPLLHRVMVSASNVKSEIIAVPPLANLIAELSLRNTCTLDVLGVFCTQLRSGHLSIRVGDSSRRSEKIVKISKCAFQCDCYYYYY